MTRNRISDASAVPLRFVIVTMDDHLTGAIMRVLPALRRDIPGLELKLHAAAEWGRDEAALARCRADIASGDIILVTMLFLEEQIEPVRAALLARRESCDAMVACMSAPEIVKLTRMGGYDMAKPVTGIAAFLKKLRGSTKGGAGAHQLKMLKRIPKILKFIPGTAQDVRAYFLAMQYFLSGSEANAANLVRFLVSRYAAGPRAPLRAGLQAEAPTDYPETGLYHPTLKQRITEDAQILPKAGKNGTVGLLLMRSYLLAGNCAHYDAVIAAIEARGYRVIPAFASGLDARPAIERFFMRAGAPIIDVLVSLTGFSLVGGPAYNDAEAAEAVLAQLDVPYLAAHAVEFQSLQDWGASDRGLMPVEATIMVAIPELDGATGAMVFGGRAHASGGTCMGCHRACTFEAGGEARPMQPCPDRIERLAGRVDRLARLRRSERAARKLGIVLFNFPPNAGNAGTAAYLAVFESLFNTLKALKQAGYSVEVPADVTALREGIVEGNAAQFGAHANVFERLPLADHVRRERYLAEIEAQWGPAPGRQQSDGRSIFVLGNRFGNVFVGLQPAFGYEGDPMRLLFEKGFAPTHAFSAFYRWLREDFGAQALLHFGTHGALEFMPGKQVGLSGASWPDRLIGDIPNIYLYASNNPSEGALAKRRAAATLVSYLTPPVTHAGLYRGLLDLKATIDRWRSLPAEASAEERADLAALAQIQAASLDLAAPEPAWGAESESRLAALSGQVLELEYALIPHGLHVMGNALSPEAKSDMLAAMADAGHGLRLAPEALSAIMAGRMPEETPDGERAIVADLIETSRKLSIEAEMPALIHALDGGFVRPVQGGDVLRSPQVLPTGRNLHGFDPFRIPSAFALADGARQAERLIARHQADGNPFPKKLALVLWGSDNVKSEGGPIAQALALMGTKPRFDTYGRLIGAELIPLETLGRPRIDVVMTLSGIFRDLLPLQTRLLADAAFRAASADEPLEQNFIRANALDYQARHGCDLETAALRVFSNADGAYGANVNHLVETGGWREEDELAECFARRKCFAYGRKGEAAPQPALLAGMLERVELTYQNLESVEVGVTTLDQYFDTLGGISRAAKRAGGRDVPVYIGDQTRGSGLVRTLGEQVALETRARMLNPKWYEGMLKHGYEGVRQIEEHVRNTVGWSATTGQVAPWVYKQLTATFVLDPAMRERLAALNPVATAKVAQRLIEAQERNYWSPDAEMLDALRDAEGELEDRIEGIGLDNAIQGRMPAANSGGAVRNMEAAA